MRAQGYQRGPSVVNAFRKYLQLGREINDVTDDHFRANLAHTHSKLGIFLEEAFPSAWKEAREIVALERAVDAP